MWRSLAGQARRCKKLKPYSISGGNLLASSPNSCSNGRSWTVVLWTRHPCTGLFQNPMASNGFLPNMTEVRCFASAAAEQESVSSEEDVSAFEEGGGLLEARSVGQHQMVGGMSKRRCLALRRRQVKVETEAWEQAAKEYKELLADMCEQKLAPNLPYMKSLFLGWFEPLTNRIVVEQESCRQAKYKSGYTYHFCQLPAEMMSVITMHKLMALLMTGGEHGVVRVVHAACAIGEAIEQEAKIYQFLEKTKKHKEDQKNNELASVSSKDRFLSKKLQELMKKQKTRLVQKIVKGQSTFKPWGQREQVKVGSRLIELLISTAYIQPPINQLADCPPEIRPAFRHYLKVVSKEQQLSGVMVLYNVIPLFARVWKEPSVPTGSTTTTIIVRHMVIPYMPMLIPPLNWKGYDEGAYLFLPSYVMRTHGARQQREAVKRTPRQQLQPVFEALDMLGSTKWKINKRVLSVIETIWATGGCLGDLVDCQDVPLPDRPDTDDEAELRKWKWNTKAARKENNERYSQRCDLELKLAVARKLRDEDGFFYPHNVDFRGRAYPMHPYLNHLGSDVCRGILEFAEGRPLGKSGLRWLKIHLANLYAGGVDKLCYDARLTFTENHLHDILDSADKPLEGSRWWLRAEDPFQCLAACINLAEALRSSSPESISSHLPVHQDGSCNGLQHYAALGRDKLGAAAVNLIAGEKPADVYSGIAARVLNTVQLDAKKNPSTDQQARLAHLLVNQVDRKFVKQTVMTSVYGVTYIGAREQIKRRLVERNVISDSKELFTASCYAAKVTLNALGEMFQEARAIMTWLGECAKIIASQNQPVRWTTPLGLPVVQPYRREGRCLIRTSLQVLTLQQETTKVMATRQRTAFPPNFVHSLDGSHMMMTAVACKKAGLNFAGVHDSYWTHACDVDLMNQILREKFVELYETPILENLLDNFQQSFPALNFPPLPERGDFDLNDVLHSPYFFN